MKNFKKVKRIQPKPKYVIVKRKRWFGVEMIKKIINFVEGYGKY